MGILPVPSIDEKDFCKRSNDLDLLYSNPKSFVNLLLPPQGIGEGWGGVKIYDSFRPAIYTLVALAYI